MQAQCVVSGPVIRHISVSVVSNLADGIKRSEYKPLGCTAAICALDLMLFASSSPAAQAGGGHNAATAGPAGLYVALVAVFCAVAAVAAAIVRRRIGSRNASSETFTSLSRIHGEIQTLSEERVSLLAELQYKDRVLNSVAAAVSQGVFWKDDQSVYRGCNEQFARWMGCEAPADVIGKTDYELLGDRKKADFYLSCDKEVMKTGIGLLDMNEMVQTASGDHIDLHVSKLPLRSGSGCIVGVIGVATEITPGRREEAHVVSVGGTLARTIDSMHEGVIVIDIDGMIVEVNSYYAGLCRRPVEELIGLNVCEAMTYPADREIIAILEKFRRSEGIAAPETFCHCVGQQDLHVRVQPIHRDGCYDGAVINFIDVSELTQAKERAEYASYRRSRFLASMSHQIRTPLSDLTGFAELLARETLSEEQLRFVEMIVSSAETIRQVVEEVADVSREHIGDFTEEDHVQRTETPELCAAEPQPKSADDQTACPDTQPAILIVDDVAENRMLLDVLLKRQGYATVQCGNGQEAVDMSGRQRFDVILMDIKMPGMDGLAATKAIRQGTLNRSTPIIAMTASAACEEEEQYLEVGCDDCIRKPVRKETLLRKVWRFIEQHKQVQAARKGGEIVSFLSDNPDYQKTIEVFIENLPQRIREMQDALDTENLQDLAFKVHLLKGLGGFAGFPIYTDLAKSIENAIHESRMDDIRSKLGEMVALCRRTRLARQ